MNSGRNFSKELILELNKLIYLADLFFPIKGETSFRFLLFELPRMFLVQLLHRSGDDLKLIRLAKKKLFIPPAIAKEL